MVGLPLAVSFIMNVMLVLFVLAAVALILIVLIQKGKGAGLSGVFGGGSSSSLFGAKTGDFLTWATVALAGVFLLLAILMARFYRSGEPQLGGSEPAASAPSAPAPSVPMPVVPVTPEKTAGHPTGAPQAEAAPNLPAAK